MRPQENVNKPLAVPASCDPRVLAEVPSEVQVVADPAGTGAAAPPAGVFGYEEDRV